MYYRAGAAIRYYRKDIKVVRRRWAEETTLVAEMWTEY